MVSAVDSVGYIARNLVEEKGIECAMLDSKTSISYVLKGRLILL